MNQPTGTAALEQKLDTLGQLIGHTPLYPLRNIVDRPGVEIYAKLEWLQLGGSVKARPAYNIVRQAILAGWLRPGMELLDASSGNTGIAYAAVGAALQLPVTLCVPENASRERKLMLRALGANIVYTSPFESTDGAQTKARELQEADPGKYYLADQYANEHNWRAHYEGTAEEIFRQTGGRMTHFVTGLGTTGTFTGTGLRLKELKPDIHLTALQPDTAMHGLEGWKHLETALVPKIYRPDLADRHIGIDTLEAYQWVRQAARLEGLLISPSAGAALAGAVKVASELEEGVVVTVFADSSDKYAEALDPLFSESVT